LALPLSIFLTGASRVGDPRTAVQAASLDRLRGEKGLKLHHVIELVVDEDALVDRISGRFSCAICNTPYHDDYKLPAVAGVCDVCGSTQFKRRADDNEEAVRTRMAEYRAKTAPILPHYEAQGIVDRVDGMAPMDEVSTAIEAILDGG
jgi:adenylate kinase